MPKDLAERLQRAETAMARFQRDQVTNRPPRRERKAAALYFKRQVTGNPRMMRFELEKLVAPLDRGAIIFVDFIGGSVVEVLVDVDYEVDVVEAMRLLRFRHMKKATPLSNFATKFRTSTAENDLLYNSSKLLQRCKNILDRVDHPVAREFFTGLQVLAESNIAKARSDGADISEEELKAPPPRKKAEQTVQLGGELVALCNERHGTRSPGGTAILIRNGVAYSRLRTEFFDRTELVAVQVLGTTIGALYSPPRASWHGLESALESFSLHSDREGHPSWRL